MERIGYSYALQKVYGYLSVNKQLELQLVRIRFYSEFGPRLLHPICIFNRKGFKLMTNSPSIQVFSPSKFEWEEFFVTERKKYFEDENQSWPTYSKIVQISEKEVCLVGGHNNFPSLLTYSYEVVYSCLIIDLSSGIVTEKSEMLFGRWDHGVAHLNNFVYAVGGENISIVNSCERYDVLTDTWTQLPDIDDFAIAVSLVVS